MKVIRLLAPIVVIWAMLWAPFSVSAECPTQGADIEFINGADTSEGNAIKYTERLRDLVFEFHPEVNPECVVFNHSYNTNEFFLLDFVEAAFQKSEEITGDGTAFLKQYFRMVPTADWFDDLVVDSLVVPINGAIGLGQYFLGDQVNEHLAKYAEHTAPFVAGGQRKRLILGGHSQGSEMAILERNALSPADQTETFVVAISALATPEPDSSLYTTLDMDTFATVLFAQFGAPPANVALAPASSCSDFGSSPWHCHAYTTYDTLPETRIVTANNIVAALPTEGGGTCDPNVPDLSPPSPPTDLTATVVSSSQIDLSWTASTDNCGIAGYHVERCQGEGCTTFVLVGHPIINSFLSEELSAETPYTFRVFAGDMTGTASSYSDTATATTLP